MVHSVDELHMNLTFDFFLIGLWPAQILFVAIIFKLIFVIRSMTNDKSVDVNILEI